MKVVLDANILISFLLTHGPTISSILDAWKQNRFTLLMSDEVLLEIKEVLNRFVVAGLLDEKSARALVRRIKRASEKINVLTIVTSSPDPKDNRYLSLSLDGNARYLVTGDKKGLLLLKRVGTTDIVSPATFAALIREELE